MPPGAPDALAEPLGVVVSLVRALDPAVAPEVVEEVVKALAARRATRRRLAQALLARPGVLVDGASPAPAVVGDLLVGLRRAGAMGISGPRCAGCAKELASFHRRGEHWYCAACGPPTLACAVCGNLRRVAARDRAGRPRCLSCPPDDGPEPITILIKVITAVDPAIGAPAVIVAVEGATSRAGQRRQLAWALEDRPELLTGAGAEAPVPSVLRLIDALVEAGSTRFVRPPCPHCGRTVSLSKTRDGLRICRGCEARLRAVPCARCGTVREPATRDADGGPMCSNCLVCDPANLEVCVGCGRRRRVNARSADGPRCESCRPPKLMTCSICGRFAAAEIAKATGEPWCRACQKRWARCAGCSQLRPVRGGSAEQPLCATCTRPDPSFWKACPTCGETTKLTAGPCAGCALRQRLRELLGNGAGEVRPEMSALFDSLAAQRPASVLDWLAGDTVAAVLADLGSERLALTHGILDDLPPAKPIEHLRAVLVATGTLAQRDEQMARLERWFAAAIAIRGDPDEQWLLRRYAVWHVLRRLRRGHNGTGTTYAQTARVKRQVRAAIALLDALGGRGVTLASCDQGHLDAWLASDGATRQRDVGHFVRWAAAEKLTRLELGAVRWSGPAGPLDGDGRWDQARRLLSDDTVDVADRVAGLLVLLYAQRGAAVSRLTIDHVERREDGVGLRLGARPVVLPEPLAGLVLDLVATRRGHAALGDQGTSVWLFPGGQPGRPISASRLTERLREIGIHAGQARSAALFQLATEPQRRCWRGCSASTSRSPSNGSVPAAATGPDTPPSTAARRPADDDSGHWPDRPQIRELSTLPPGPPIHSYSYCSNIRLPHCASTSTPCGSWRCRGREARSSEHPRRPRRGLLGHAPVAGLQARVRRLPQLAAFIDAAGASTLTVELTVAWAGLRKGTVQPISLSRRLGEARGFARYLRTIDPVTEIPPTGNWPSTAPRAIPYIWTDTEIGALLDSTSRLSPLRAVTHRTLFGLLAATGMRVGEAMGLDRGDVELDGGVVTIRDGKFGRSRLVPLHASTSAALRSYAAHRDQLCPAAPSMTFFVSTAGTALRPGGVRSTFIDLTTGIGLRTATVRPRVHDMQLIAERLVAGFEVPQ